MTIEVARVERTAVVTMQRPAVRNAMSSEMAEELDAAFTELAVDDEVWAGW